MDNSERIGISCMGWPSIEYGKIKGFQEHLSMLSKITKCIEIPSFPYSWIYELKEYLEVNDVSLYSLHIHKHIVDEPQHIQRYLLHCERRISNNINVCEIVAHPFDRHADINEINEYVKQLMSLGKHVSIELTNPFFNDQFRQYMQNPQIGMTIDFSHYIRMFGEDVSQLKNYPVTHVHVRGYAKNRNYTQVKDSGEIIRKLIYSLMCENYRGKFMLEYPYLDYEAACADIEFINECLR